MLDRTHAMHMFMMSGLFLGVFEGWCQDMDFSKRYELGLEEKSLGTFPRIR